MVFMNGLKNMKQLIKKKIRMLIMLVLPELKEVLNKENNFKYIRNSISNSSISDKSMLYGPYSIWNVDLGDYSYIMPNSNINNTKIGKFCSIGPNFISGCGIHPTGGISTAPMFYANNLSNGITFCDTSKIEETKPISIGNDVWIGINVTILDGVNVGNGAIIAAGSVVNKDIPAYSIYGGVPAKLIRYRFSEKQILDLQKIEWWNFNYSRLKEIERSFFDIDKFIKDNSL